jgi:hypothetical protein
VKNHLDQLTANPTAKKAISASRANPAISKARVSRPRAQLSQNLLLLAQRLSRYSMRLLL